MRAWRGNACNGHQKRRKPGSHSFLILSLIWTTCLLRSIKWEGDGLDLGLSGVGDFLWEPLRRLCVPLLRYDT